MVSRFDVDSILPRSVFARITEARVAEPHRVFDEAKGRERRSSLTTDGHLVIAAADHPGRFVTAAAGDPLAMADRRQYLARILRVLTQPQVDGVMSTPDVIEELLILGSFQREKTGRSFLDRKAIVGSMNRGGLSGTVFEMRDRFGSFGAARIKSLGLDGAKMMFRLDVESHESGATIQDCADALDDLHEHEVPAFLEPLPVEHKDGRYSVIKTAEALSRVIGVATALGGSSRLLWLKVPYVQEYSTVAASTSCPMLMLGGGSRDDPEEILGEFAAGLAAGSNVRGVLVGRNILFPGENDPATMAAAVGRIVHDRLPVPEAAELFRRDSLESEPASIGF